MGNDTSRLKGLEIDKNAVEANDFWALYNAEMPTTSDEGRQRLSIFQGEPVVTGQLWVAQGPMERAIKNFRIYRHPYILKYVATWEQGGQKHLATERVRPLIAEVATLSDIQICLGLRTILCSLIFLIEKAQARHLNICISSIYIAEDGSWRLAGFEYVWKYKELTKKLLDFANAYRYKPAIDACELQDAHSDCIEQYAFATLCEEILAKCTRNITATPHATDFRDYCATHLKHKQQQMRPRLSAVLLHPYFNHEFVLIHSFLIELPLKSLVEKQDFFSGLVERLRSFQEDVVGAQLGALLLSRMVLLDPTAQLCVTPYVLRTRSDHVASTSSTSSTATSTAAALFSSQTYARCLLPHIKKHFRLRDAQIRLILLEYFMEFVRLLSAEDLREFVLPHLQEGMRDTNDILVAKTLRCLADLVPLLGSAIVLGGERTRLFADGRPQAALHDKAADDAVAVSWQEPRSITPVMSGGDSAQLDYMLSSGSPLPEALALRGSFNSLSQSEEMPPRLSPDGGEDEKLQQTLLSDGQTKENSAAIYDKQMEQVSLSSLSIDDDDAVDKENKQLANVNNASEVDEEEDDIWSDWETDELQRLHSNNLEATSNLPPMLSLNINQAQQLPSQASLSDSFRTTQSTSSNASLKTAKINDDLNALDIIVQKSATALTPHQDAFDFFKDMEPVIITQSQSATKVVAVAEEEIKIDASRFAALGPSELSSCDDVDAAADGWAVDDDDDDAVGNVTDWAAV